SLGHTLYSFDLTENNWDKFIELLTQVKPNLVLNALHGTFGEDGGIQTKLDELHIPYSHSNAQASRNAMNKAITKTLCSAQVPMPQSSVYSINNCHPNLPFPFVLKALEQGSTFGVYLINSQEELNQILKTWEYGETVLIEQYIKGREFTVSILDQYVLGI